MQEEEKKKVDLNYFPQNIMTLGRKNLSEIIL